MHTRSKLVLIGLGAALLMAASVGSASAGRYSISHGELFRLSWASLRFQIIGITDAECPVTLEASLHSRTTSKVAGTLLGYITRASLGRCITGNATILSETLPWHVQYGGFNEALPRPKPIINITGFALQINNAVTGVCLMRTTATEPLTVITEPTYEAGGNGIAERLTTDETKSMACPPLGRGTIAGSSAVTDSSGARNVLIRLI